MSVAPAPPVKAFLKQTVYTANDTFTPDPNANWTHVKIVGGGAGGIYNSVSNGPNGGTTSFGAHCTATGGTKGKYSTSGAFVTGGLGGSGSGGDINGDGGVGGDSIGASKGGRGGASIMGEGAPPEETINQDNDAVNHGSGGSGAGKSGDTTSGGGAGGWSEKWIAKADMGATETVTIGAGGTGINGGNGQDGICIVTEFK